MRSSSRARRGFRVEAKHDAGAQAQAGQGQCPEGDTATEQPAARVLVVEVARGRADHDDVRCLHQPRFRSRPGPGARAGHVSEKPILGPVTLRDGDAPPYYFYELHESDTDLFADVLLAHETEYDEAEFLELVLEARKRVIDDYGEDSLIEAVAAELAAQAGFLIIDDSQLRVAVNVSADEEGTFVADVDEIGGAWERRGGGLPHHARGRRARRCGLGRGRRHARQGRPPQRRLTATAAPGLPRPLRR